MRAALRTDRPTLATPVNVEPIPNADPDKLATPSVSLATERCVETDRIGAALGVDVGVVTGELPPPPPHAVKSERIKRSPVFFKICSFASAFLFQKTSSASLEF